MATKKQKLKVAKPSTPKRGPKNSIKTSLPAAVQLTKKDHRREAKKVAKSKTLPSSWQLAKHSWQLLSTHRVILLKVTFIYLFFTVLVVQGIGSLSTPSTINVEQNWWNRAYATLSGIADGNSSGSETVSLLQLLLFIIQSLVLIWLLRRLIASSDKLPSLKDSYYLSLTPLVPFLGLLAIVVIECIPLLLGGSLLGALATGTGNGLVVSVCIVLFVTLAAWSMYLLSVSVMALYSVTLPAMGPLQALRATKQVIQYRRLQVIRKMAFLFAATALTILVAMILIITIFTALAPLFFYILISLAITISYLYGYLLYKELLK